MSASRALSPILVVPSVEAGRGGGHLARCAALVRDLRALGQEAVLFLGPLPGAAPAPPSAALKTLAPLLAELKPSWVLRDPGAGPWRFIVLDRFQTPAPEYRFWASLAFLVGIDEGGPCRARFDFLIDLLPSPPGHGAPNFLDPALLPLPHTVRPQSPPEDGPRRILISFGAEDAAGLGRACAALLCSPPGKGAAGEDSVGRVTLIDPQAGSDSQAAGPVAGPDKGALLVVRNIPNLAEQLAEYDLVITHFGLSAFEALRAATPVLLVSPGSRHERLARAAGFTSAGIGKRGARRIGGFLRGAAWTSLLRGCDALAHRHGVIAGYGGAVSVGAGYGDDGRAGLADLLATFEPAGHRCPGCGTGQEAGPFQPVLARFPDRSFRRCTSCGLIYMSRINKAPIEYGREYFFEFYQRQYGKTYIEDFPQLVDMGKRRLTRILSLRGQQSPGKLLDIGCAYGPFLKAAAQGGFDVCGIDPAEDAVCYVRDKLGLRALQGLFPGAEGERLPASSFQVITLWYVIEHIGALAQALGEAGRLLEEGGVLAFSTPSFTGISGRTSLRKFLEHSPADHWSIWSPRVARRLLRPYGFTLKKVVSTGHHPERFPLPGCGAKNGETGGKGPLYRLVLFVSRVFGLGDTFEVYAVKKPAATRKHT